MTRYVREHGVAVRVDDFDAVRLPALTDFGKASDSSFNWGSWIKSDGTVKREGVGPRTELGWVVEMTTADQSWPLLFTIGPYLCTDRWPLMLTALEFILCYFNPLFCCQFYPSSSEIFYSRISAVERATESSINTKV